MRRILTKTGLAAGLIFLLTSAVYAQTSATSTSSAGFYSTDADSFMNPTGFQGLQKSKFFGFINLDLSSEFGVGAATNIGKYYLSTYYNGNLFNGLVVSNKNTQSDSENENLFILNRDAKSQKNNLSFLLGFDKTGIKTGINMTTNNAFSDMGGKDKETYSLVSSYTPYIRVARKETLENLTLKPYVETGYYFGINSTKKTEEDENGIFSADLKDEEKDNDYLYLTLGSSFSFKKVTAVSHSCSFSLQPKFYFWDDLYCNTKSVTDASTAVTDFYRDRGRFDLKLSQGYSGYISAKNGFAFAFGASLPVEFNFKNYGNYKAVIKDSVSGTKTLYGSKYNSTDLMPAAFDSFTLIVTPELKGAVQWKINKFLSAHFGARLYTPKFTYTHENAEYDRETVSSQKNENYSKTVNSDTLTWTAVSGNLYSGLRFAVTSNVILDTYVKIFNGRRTSFDDIWNAEMQLQLLIKF